MTLPRPSAHSAVSPARQSAIWLAAAAGLVAGIAGSGLHARTPSEGDAVRIAQAGAPPAVELRRGSRRETQASASISADLARSRALLADTLTTRFLASTRETGRSAEAQEQAWLRQRGDVARFQQAAEASIEAADFERLARMARLAEPSARNETIQFALAADLFARGDAAAAATAFAALRRPLDSEAQLARLARHAEAWARLAAGDSAGALDLIEPERRRQPEVSDQRSGLLSAGLILERSGQTDAALDRLRAAVAGPVTLPCVRAIGDVLVRVGARGEALRFQGEFMSNDPSVTDDLWAAREAVRRGGQATASDPRTLAAVSLFSLIEEMTTEAAERDRRAMEAAGAPEGSAPAFSPPPLTWLRALERIDPNGLVSGMSVGIALWQRGHREAAMARLESVPPQSVEYAAAQVTLSLMREGQPLTGRIDSLKAGLAARPDSAPVAVHLAALLGEAGRQDEALEAWNTALRAAAHLPDGNLWPWYLGRAETLSRLSRWQEADADINRARATARDNPRARLPLGRALLARGGHIDEAARLLRDGVAAAGGPALVEPAAAEALGRALMQAGAHEEALDALEAASAQGSGDSDSDLLLGDAYWLSGRPDEARLVWTRALARVEDPGRRSALEARIADGAPPTAPAS